jgi:prephenate dehydratase
VEKKRMKKREVAYLGPIGTYSHLVAEKRFGTSARLVPFPTILDVCEFVARRPERFGIVPIENSSGGAIYETVDILIENKPRIRIEEELSLNVALALLGRKNEKIKVLYSHFAPLEHCSKWIRKSLPGAERRTVGSTAAAAIQAAGWPGATALGNRRLARIYGLDVLAYPVQSDLPNLTVFYCVSGRHGTPSGTEKTTLAVRLPNTPGSLCNFLDIFRARRINLSRLISRPVRGCPREYAFLIDVNGGLRSPGMSEALKAARKTTMEMRVAGSYPARKPYSS